MPASYGTSAPDDMPRHEAAPGEDLSRLQLAVFSRREQVERRVATQYQRPTSPV